MAAQLLFSRGETTRRRALGTALVRAVNKGEETTEEKQRRVPHPRLSRGRSCWARPCSVQEGCRLFSGGEACLRTRNRRERAVSRLFFPADCDSGQEGVNGAAGSGLALRVRAVRQASNRGAHPECSDGRAMTTPDQPSFFFRKCCSSCPPYATSLVGRCGDRPSVVTDGHSHQSE